MSKNLDQTLLSISQRQWTAMVVLGFIFFLAGGFYCLWGLDQADFKKTPDIYQAFDRPVVKIAVLARENRQWMDDALAKAKTTDERIYLEQLKVMAQTNTRLILLVIRSFIGGVGMAVGLVFVSSGTTAHRFLKVLKRYQKQKLDESLLNGGD